MANALIYSANFDGHRQVYAFVLTDILQKSDYNVFIAGNLKSTGSDSFYIRKLSEDSSITFIDTSNYNNSGASITGIEFLELQNKCRADLTILAEADNHIALINSQLGNKSLKFRGRIMGIFLRPFFFYQKKSFLNHLKHFKNLSKTWRTDTGFFHKYILRYSKVLDAAFYIDEKFASTNSRIYRWLPDVFQQYAESILKEENADQNHWKEELNEFIGRNKGKFVFLYFGTAQARRGYDILMKMAVDHSGCFVHCGLSVATDSFGYDVQNLKDKLINSGSLFETREYITDPGCIEYFFRSASHIILPYRNFAGSSGIMIQALEYGIPVLVPDFGIIGHRVRKFGLGAVYNQNDERGLDKSFIHFSKSEPSSYRHSIQQFMQYQSADLLQSVLEDAIAGKNPSKDLPEVYRA